MNQYSTRQFIIGSIIVLVVFVYLIRLFYIQIIDDTYKLSAENNSQRYVTQYPSRGTYLRQKRHVVGVCNKAAYDLMVNPQELRPFDTTEFCSILNITKEQVKETIRRAIIYSRYKSSPFMYQVSDIVYARLQEKII